MPREVSGSCRVLASSIHKTNDQVSAMAKRIRRENSRASQLLDRAAREILDLRQQLEGARAYARLLEKRLAEESRA